MENSNFSPIILSTSNNNEMDSFDLNNSIKQTADEYQKIFINYVNNGGANISSIINYVNNGGDNISSAEFIEWEEYALTLNKLIQIGDFNLIKKFCDIFSADELKQILNVAPKEMYYGNMLHSTLYFNKGIPALQIYKYFRENGAKPFKNYYSELPWEQKGILWTEIPNENYERDPNEFSETYEVIRNYENGLLLETRFNRIPCHCLYHLESDYDSSESYEYNIDYDEYVSSE